MVLYNAWRYCSKIISLVVLEVHREMQSHTFIDVTHYTYMATSLQASYQLILILEMTDFVCEAN